MKYINVNSDGWEKSKDECRACSTIWHTSQGPPQHAHGLRIEHHTVDIHSERPLGAQVIAAAGAALHQHDKREITDEDRNHVRSYLDELRSTHEQQN